MKILGGRGGHDNLHVVFGRQHQEAFQARAGVFGALPFKPVRQQHDQAAQASPFVLGAGDELVDDHLGRVGEIAELGFPHHQAIGKHQAVAIFEAQARRLRTAGC